MFFKLIFVWIFTKILGVISQKEIMIKWDEYHRTLIFGMKIIKSLKQLNSHDVSVNFQPVVSWKYFQLAVLGTI
jgi:hypothetical protein